MPPLNDSLPFFVFILGAVRIDTESFSAKDPIFDFMYYILCIFIFSFFCTADI